MSAPRTILVVEDDSIVRMLLIDVLEEEEYKVLEASTGSEAREFLDNSDCDIDLMMTDKSLPDIDGELLAKQARESRPELPILFASGQPENIDVPPDMHIIGKPFSIDQLRAKVRTVLGEP